MSLLIFPADCQGEKNLHHSCSGSLSANWNSLSSALSLQWSRKARCRQYARLLEGKSECVILFFFFFCCFDKRFWRWFQCPSFHGTIFLFILVWRGHTGDLLRLPLLSRLDCTFASQPGWLEEPEMRCFIWTPTGTKAIFGWKRLSLCWVLTISTLQDSFTSFHRLKNLELTTEPSSFWQDLHFWFFSLDCLRTSPHRQF